MIATFETKAHAVTPSHELNLLREMLRIRRFEERCVELHGIEKIRGFPDPYFGEEAVAVGAMQTLSPRDRIVSTYHEHGHALARGVAMGPLMAEMYGKRNGCCRGRGGPTHLFDVSHRFCGGYAIVGGGLPIAVGLALADKIKKHPFVTACFFGAGDIAEGEFQESMNLAAAWKLPVLFICENNLHAVGTSLDWRQAQVDIAVKAFGCGVPATAVDGTDVKAVEAAMLIATERIRSGEGPYLLECRTYRFHAHSMYEPAPVSGKDGARGRKKRCPIETFEAYLTGKGLLSARQIAEMESSIAKEIDESIAFAEAGEREPVADLLRDVVTPEKEADAK